jgi:hypothetical protein
MTEENDEAQQEYEYLWRHFAFNADQRLKAFNFFVVFSVFANGGVFAAVEKDLPPLVFVLIGSFVCALALVFWAIDRRSKQLLNLDVPGLKKYEERFRPESRIFANADMVQSRFGYKAAFHTLFLLQGAFGVGVMIYGIGRMLCTW